MMLFSLEKSPMVPEWLCYYYSCDLIVKWNERFQESSVQIKRQVAMLLYAAAAKSLQSCPTLCDLIDGSSPGFPVPGILQARTLEWVAISSPVHESEKWKWSHSVMSDSSDPMDCNPPGSSVHGIFQARVLEWGATAFSVLYATIF